MSDPTPASGRVIEGAVSPKATPAGVETASAPSEPIPPIMTPDNRDWTQVMRLDTYYDNHGRQVQRRTLLVGPTPEGFFPYVGINTLKSTDPSTGQVVDERPYVFPIESITEIGDEGADIAACFDAFYHYAVKHGIEARRQYEAHMRAQMQAMAQQQRQAKQGIVLAGERDMPRTPPRPRG